ncbi:uncharacterized protein LOC125525419 isoform X2 [Triticum urartu]|uniref:uncharacterized protein LOC125525419 isoform X2 n=1 Tax=Triticum urartu TaxID=4572 RepID=UPI00204323ED|nr:uncharacterized protein LOC125525419 isoform X2 [Triticum urartu]
MEQSFLCPPATPWIFLCAPSSSTTRTSSSSSIQGRTRRRRRTRTPLMSSPHDGPPSLPLSSFINAKDDPSSKQASKVQYAAAVRACHRRHEGLLQPEGAAPGVEGCLLAQWRGSAPLIGSSYDVTEEDEKVSPAGLLMGSSEEDLFSSLGVRGRRHGAELPLPARDAMDLVLLNLVSSSSPLLSRTSSIAAASRTNEEEELEKHPCLMVGRPSRPLLLSSSTPRTTQQPIKQTKQAKTSGYDPLANNPASHQASKDAYWMN